MKMKYAAAVTVGLVGAGVVSYVLMNKKTKHKADKLLNTVMDQANSRIKQFE